MGPEAVEAVDQVIKALASAFNVSSEFVWPILVKQARISGVMDLGMGAMFLVATYVLGHLSVFCKRRWNDEGGDWHVGVILLATFAAFMFICSVIFMTCGIKEVINPEYYAIKDILKTTGGH